MGRLTVLFDLDGTLIDTHPLIVRCFQESLAELAGLSCTEERCHPLLGRPLGEMFHTVISEHPALAEDPELLDRLIQDYRVRMRAGDGELQPFPGIPECLRTLRQWDCRLGVVTTKHQGLAERHLQATGLTEHFETVVCGDHTEEYKPHPAPFLLALRRLEATPESAVMIGDSPADVLGAHAAGLRAALGAAWGTADRTALKAARPHHVLGQPREITPLLAEWLENRRPLP